LKERFVDTEKLGVDADAGFSFYSKPTYLGPSRLGYANARLVNGLKELSMNTGT
jgi:hypothetical protein